MSDLQYLFRKLEIISPLDPQDRSAISNLPMSVKSLPAGANISLAKKFASQCCLLLSGMMFRYRVYKAGQRQIVSFHVPGDILNLDILHLNTADHSLVATMPVTIGAFHREALRDLAAARSGVAHALWREALVDSAICKEWLTNIGRRPALERLAHLICEIYYRRLAVGLAAALECEFPVTQAEMADALGLSPVHVNRMLQELRAEGLLTLAERRLKIHDWESLCLTADFDPQYLQTNTADF